MKKPLLTFLLLLLFSSCACAVKVTSLYQASVPVASQSDEEREQAARAGFAEMMIKVSGDPEILKNELIRTSLKKADYYIEEYSYSTSPSASQYILQIKYDADSVNALLKKAGISLWSVNRPLLLVWLSVADDAHPAEILGGDTSGHLLESIKQLGKRYGLPLIFPMMDVADVSVVSPEDIMNDNLSILEEAGNRYAPDGLLVVKVTTSSNHQYESEWQLVLHDHPENTVSFAISAETVEAVIEKGLGQVNQKLSKRLTVKPLASASSGSSHWIKLHIENVTQPGDLAQITEYLKQMTNVQQVQLVEVSGSVVQLSILLRGSFESFTQNMSAGPHFITRSQVAENSLVYEWAH